MTVMAIRHRLQRETHTWVVPAEQAEVLEHYKRRFRVEEVLLTFHRTFTAGDPEPLLGVEWRMGTPHLRGRVIKKDGTFGKDTVTHPMWYEREYPAYVREAIMRSKALLGADTSRVTW